MKKIINQFICLAVFAVSVMFGGCALQTASDNPGIKIGKAEKTSGILIHDVQKGGPAELAGIQEGDIIVSYGGKPIIDLKNLEHEIAETLPDEKVVLEVMRGESLLNIGMTFKKKGWKIVNVSPDSEHPDYAINLIGNFLWIGTFPHHIEENTFQRILPPYSLYDPEHLPANPPTFFTITW